MELLAHDPRLPTGRRRTAWSRTAQTAGGVVLGEHQLAGHAELDLLGAEVGTERADDRSRVLGRLEQARDHQRLVGPDRRRGGRQADVGGLLHHVAIRVHQPVCRASRAIGSTPLAARSRRRRSPACPGRRGVLPSLARSRCERSSSGSTPGSRRHGRWLGRRPPAPAQLDADAKPWGLRRAGGGSPSSPPSTSDVESSVQGTERQTGSSTTLGCWPLTA